MFGGNMDNNKTFGERMNEILDQQKCKRSPEELYQICLEGNFERMISNIEKKVVFSGEREGEVGGDHATFQCYEDIQTPYVYTDKQSNMIRFNPLLSLKRSVQKAFFGNSGRFVYTVETADAGKRVFKDLREMFDKEGISIKIGYIVTDELYETTVEKKGLLDADGRHTYSIETKDVRSPFKYIRVFPYYQYTIR